MPLQPLWIRGKVVEDVEDYRYLGVVNRLDWKSNTEAVYKKGMSRLYFLRKLRSFNVCSKMLEIFHQSVVASAIFFAAVCWGSSFRASDMNRLDKIIKKAGSVLGLWRLLRMWWIYMIICLGCSSCFIVFLLSLCVMLLLHCYFPAWDKRNGGLGIKSIYLSIYLSIYT